MTFDEWLRYGTAAGYCSPILCLTHDWDDDNDADDDDPDMDLCRYGLQVFNLR